VEYHFRFTSFYLRPLFQERNLGVEKKAGCTGSKIYILNTTNVNFALKKMLNDQDKIKVNSINSYDFFLIS